MAEPFSEGSSLVKRGAFGDFLGAPAIRAQNNATKQKAAALNRRIAANRRAAGPVENRQEGPLRHKFMARRGMGDPVHGSPDPGIADPRDQRDCALADSRNEAFPRQHLSDRISKPKPLEPGHREDHRIKLAIPGLFEPRADIAAQGFDPQVWPHPANHGLAAQRNRSHPGPLRQRRQRAVARGDHRIPAILARQEAGNFQPLGQDCGQILRRMDSNIHPPLKLGNVDFLREQALATNFRERPVLRLVPGGGDDLGMQSRLGDARMGHQGLAGHAGLCQRQRRTARSDNEEGARLAHGHGSERFPRLPTKAGTRPVSIQWNTSLPCRCRFRTPILCNPGSAIVETGGFPVQDQHRRMIRVLGIETTCDETSAAIVQLDRDGSRRILSNRIRSQIAEHRPFGGVVPEIAARAHVDILDRLIREAVEEAKVSLTDLDAVAAAAGPGLIGGVLVGLTTGKAIALGLGKPILAINHLEAHALTPRLTEDLNFPYLLLLASGGHTQLVAVCDVGRYVRIGTTIDDAIGEAFDKVAKMLSLGFPGGPAVEAAAREGDPERFALPRPLFGKPDPDFSLSGLKTAVRLAAEAIQPLKDQDVADLCASFQAAVVDCVIDRTRIGIRHFRKEFGQPSALVIAGGVGANRAIRHALQRSATEAGLRLVIPPPQLCTDNGAMIAWAGIERLQRGLIDDLDAVARPRWPLDESRAKPGARA